MTPANLGTVTSSGRAEKCHGGQHDGEGDHLNSFHPNQQSHQIRHDCRHRSEYNLTNKKGGKGNGEEEERIHST